MTDREAKTAVENWWQLSPDAKAAAAHAVCRACCARAVITDGTVYVRQSTTKLLLNSTDIGVWGYLLARLACEEGIIRQTPKEDRP